MTPHPHSDNPYKATAESSPRKGLPAPLLVLVWAVYIAFLTVIGVTILGAWFFFLLYYVL